MADNIRRFPLSTGQVRSELAIAEENRLLCLSGAASFVEALQMSVRDNPENVSAAKMDRLLGLIVRAINDLKGNTVPGAPTPGSAA